MEHPLLARSEVAKAPPRKHLRRILWLASLCCLGSGLGGEHPFATSSDLALAGRFSGPTVHVLARPEGEAWHGEITRNGVMHLMQARISRDHLEGVEITEQKPLPFVLTRRTDGFHFASGSFSEVLQKVSFPPLSGLYTARTLNVWITPAGIDAYEGSIGFRGRQMAFQGQVRNGDLHGLFESSSGWLSFTVANEPRGLVFRSGTLGDILIKAKDQPAAAHQQPFPTLAARWTNSLGMHFVPVPNASVLFSVWETRVRDYSAYASEVPGVFSSWRNPVYKSVAVGNSKDHPVVNVNQLDAAAYCEWLTAREQAMGTIAKTQFYRLPTDGEWSAAVGIAGLERAGSIKERNARLDAVYPWGREWPPPAGAGNYADQAAAKLLGAEILAKYRDGFVTTAPVGSFAPNNLGIFDLGGNVWEWCSDRYEPAKAARVLRGGAWSSEAWSNFLSSFRYDLAPDARSTDVGFRCVLAGAAASPTAAPTAPTSPAGSK